MSPCTKDNEAGTLAFCASGHRGLVGLEAGGWEQDVTT